MITDLKYVKSVQYFIIGRDLKKLVNFYIFVKTPGMFFCTPGLHRTLVNKDHLTSVISSVFLLYSQAQRHCSSYLLPFSPLSKKGSFSPLTKESFIIKDSKG